MTDTQDLTAPEAVERLIVWLMDTHETGNTEKNPEVWRTLEALSAELEYEKRHKLAIAGVKIDAVSELRQVKAERDALKAELADAVETLKEVSQSLDWIAHGCCRGWSQNLMTSADALGKSRAFLSRHQGNGATNQKETDT